MLDLVSLKEKYSRIQQVTIGNYDIIFRLLSLKEFDVESRMLNLPLYDIEENYNRLFQRVVLDPVIRDSMPGLPAGVISSLCGLVIYLSGIIIGDEESMARFNDTLAIERFSVQQSPYEQMFAIICSAFSGYRISDLENLSMPEVMRLTALAEMVLRVDEPFAIMPATQAKRMTDTIFQDATQAAEVDNIQNLSPKQRQDMEVIKRVQESRQNG